MNTFPATHKRVLINNYYRNISPRGVIAYVSDLEEFLDSANIPHRVLTCPRFMERWPKQGFWFHLFEQIYVPLIGLKYSVVIYPYNSAALFSIFHSGSLLVVHDFIAYRRKLPGYGKLSVALVRCTQRIYQLSRRNVAYITKDIARHAKFSGKFRHCKIYLLPNTFLRFRRRTERAASQVQDRSDFILLCTGKAPTKDLAGALRLYETSEVANNVKLVILGLAGSTELVDATIRHQPTLRDSITVLPIVSDDKVIELYKSASAVWVHSMSEGFGRNIAEALICGAKVVASNIRPFRNQARSSRNVYLYRNGNHAQFASALKHLLASDYFPENLDTSVEALHKTFHDLLTK